MRAVPHSSPRAHHTAGFVQDVWNSVAPITTARPSGGRERRPIRILLFMLWGMSLGVTVSVLTLADYSSSLAGRVQSGYSVEPTLIGPCSLHATARID